jgi:hypothetical protein
MTVIDVVKKAIPYIPWAIALVLGLMWGKSCSNNGGYKDAIKLQTKQEKVLKASADSAVNANKAYKVENAALKESVRQKDVKLAEKDVQAAQIRSTYEQKLTDAKKHTPAQSDSAIAKRYPGVPKDSISGHVEQDLITGDQCKAELANARQKVDLLESQKLDFVKQVYNDSLMNANLEKAIVDLKGANIAADGKALEWEKLYKKARRNNIFYIGGGSVLAILGLTLAVTHP